MPVYTFQDGLLILDPGNEESQKGLCRENCMDCRLPNTPGNESCVHISSIRVKSHESEEQYKEGEKWK